MVAAWPTRRGWGVLVLAGLLLGAWWWVGVREILLLAVLLACAIVVSVLTALVVALVMPRRLRLVARPAAPVVGEDLVVSLEAAGPLPVTADLQWSLDPGPARVNSPLLVRRGMPAYLSFRATHRGLVEVRTRYLRWTDPLHLAHSRRACPADLRILVLPAALGEECGVVGVRAESGVPKPVDEGEATTIREYRPGDPPRRVHWKQSARQGRLLVTVPEQPEHVVRRVCLDLRAPSWGGPGEFEVAVSLVVTLLKHWQGDEVEVILGEDLDRVGAGGGGRVRPGEEKALRALAVVDPESEDPAPKDLGLKDLTPEDLGPLSLGRSGLSILEETATLVTGSLAEDCPGGARLLRIKPSGSPGGWVVCDE